MEYYLEGCDPQNWCEKMEEDIKDVMKNEQGVKMNACELVDLSRFFEALDAAVEKEENKELDLDFSNVNWG